MLFPCVIPLQSPAGKIFCTSKRVKIAHRRIFVDKIVRCMVKMIYCGLVFFLFLVTNGDQAFFASDYSIPA